MIEDICKRIALLKQMKEYHEAMSDMLGGEIYKISQTAYTEMASKGTDQIRVSGSLFKDGQARIISPDVKFKTSVVNPPMFFDYLRANEFGTLIKEKVNPKTLESWVNGQKENNMPLPTEDILKIFTLETVSVRRAPKS
jgi:hypothetical protein